MSDTPPIIDDGAEIMDDLIGVYRQTSDALRATHNYIDANSNFWAGVGLLMVCAKGVYDFAKSKTLEALTTTQDAVSTTREYLDGYREDLWENEKRIIDDLGELDVVCEQIVVIQIQNSNVGASTGGSTGGSAGGFSSAGAGAGGAGFSMPSSPAPTAPTPPTSTTDPTDGPDIHVDVTVDGDGNVKVNVDGDGNEDVDVTVKVEGDGDVDVTVDGEAVDATGDDATTDTGDDGDDAGDDADAGSGGGSAGGGSDGATDDSGTGASGDGSPTLEDGSAPPASPEQQAKEAAFYDRMWKEQAAHDPLGRSADELRLAWEEREPLVFDDSLVHAGAGIGYGDARHAFPASFHIDAQKARTA